MLARSKKQRRRLREEASTPLPNAPASTDLGVLQFNLAAARVELDRAEIERGFARQTLDRMERDWAIAVAKVSEATEALRHAAAKMLGQQP